MPKKPVQKIPFVLCSDCKFEKNKGDNVALCTVEWRLKTRVSERICVCFEKK